MTTEKGTAGILYGREDMPTTKEGITPTIILNPNAFPKRRTIAHLFEVTYAKYGAYHGVHCDGTPFNEVTIESIYDKLQETGYDGDCKEEMYSGFTGQKFEARICIGPTFYQRLKHLVADKLHCLTGDHEILTSLGWKNIKLIGMADHICTLDAGVITYVTPTKIYGYTNNNEPLFEFVQGSIRQTVTQNHKLYVHNSIQNTKELALANIVSKWPTNYSFVTCGKNNNTEFNVNTLISSLPESETDHWIKFYGHYIMAHMIEIYDRPQLIDNKHTKVLTEILASFGIKYTIDNSHIVLDVSDDNRLYIEICNFIETHKFGSWVWQLSKRQAFALHEIFYQNKVRKFGDESFNSELDRLCLHTGVSYSEHSPISEILIKPPEPVYCVSVPSEIFYVRKSGFSPCWTGNSRAKGPYQLWTRQPLEGRAKNGGPRVGDMEVWSLLSHGIAQTMKERFMECSDKSTFYICADCGMICIANKFENNYLCTICDNRTNIRKIEIPYAAKLWLQLMIMMGVSPRLKID